MRLRFQIPQEPLQEKLLLQRKTAEGVLIDLLDLPAQFEAVLPGLFRLPDSHDSAILGIRRLVDPPGRGHAIKRPGQRCRVEDEFSADLADGNAVLLPQGRQHEVLHGREPVFLQAALEACAYLLVSFCEEEKDAVIIVAHDAFS